MLYFLLVKVFNTGLGQRKLFYLCLGWGEYEKLLYMWSSAVVINHCVVIAVGLPVPIVAIAAGIAHTHYGTND